MIIINYDFVSGKELSYVEGCEKKDDFETNVLTFFCFDQLENGVDVKVVKKNGDYIILSELLRQDNGYCEKELRPAHNVYKLLVAEMFDFKREEV